MGLLSSLTFDLLFVDHRPVSNHLCSQYGREVRRLIPVKDEAAARKKILWKTVFDGFDRIDGVPTQREREVGREGGKGGRGGEREGGRAGGRAGREGGRERGRERGGKEEGKGGHREACSFAKVLAEAKGGTITRRALIS